MRASGAPLAAPSANASGRISPTTADHVLHPDGGLDGRIAAVLDGGACPVGVESTIIGWQDGRPTLLRPGGIPAEVMYGVPVTCAGGWRTWPRRTWPMPA